ncbi:RHS repeat-associated core domain-containing protein [Pseudoxanthomonas sp. SL93]|uniref:RHS repeat domain-containing protein n=1 Tax=Pseudoxanthomonas sp. SL93 TaxID=2995142 RepID=UPI00226FAFFB|nr:RHS repeat-associated core domain-containing protein [Pseudoxanthomonas sp. SL93]WAC63611.1 RHS repeat-associated core domain-containing protein [Pseudoxanthomonas sp. SL93]
MKTSSLIRKLVVVALVAVAQFAAAQGALAQTVVEYLHTDALGSPVAVTNQAGQVIERNDYEPYGAVIGNPGFSGVGFTGHVQDGGTGLTYMQQRYYDPEIGRFLSIDPVSADSIGGANFNRYWYANNNPYRFTDPDGRYTCDTAGTRIRCPIHGNAQNSQKTPGHASTSQRIANKEAARPGAKSVHLNQRLTTVTGNQNAPKIQPDVTVVNKNGTIDMHEVRSVGQTRGELVSKLSDARAGLGVPGKNIVVDPDVVPRGSGGSTVRGLGALGILHMIFHEWVNQREAAEQAKGRASMPMNSADWIRCLEAKECA